MMTDEYIVRHGYKMYEPLSIDNDGIVQRFQKRFDDEVGKKYFIDIEKWDWNFTDRVPYKYSYEYGTQLYKKGCHSPLNIKFFADWSLKEVEEFMEEIWRPDIFDYYEKWE